MTHGTQRISGYGTALGMAAHPGRRFRNHVLSVVMFPVVLLVVSWPRVRVANGASPIWRNRRWNWRSFGLVVAGVAVGLLSYLILPLRAAAHPAVNWGDSVTVDRFLWLVTGRLY